MAATPTMLDVSPCESEDGGYGSLNAESSFDTTCSKANSVNTTALEGSQLKKKRLKKSVIKFKNKSRTHTSVFFGLLVGSSCVGECGLLGGAPLMESSRPLGSSLGLLVAVGFTLLLMELLHGGEGGFALRGGSSG